MNQQPAVSCICLTYGRPHVLEEAIYSFLRQDYGGRKELIILNDYVEQTLRFDHPEVRVINLPVRFRTVGEKRNAAIALAKHDLLFVWDDDDIYLSHRLRFSVANFDLQKGYFKANLGWYLDNDRLRGPEANLFHANGCWLRSRFDAVRGYDSEGSGHDWLFEKRMTQRFPCTLMCHPEFIDQALDTQSLLQWIQVLPLDIFDQRHRQCRFIGYGANQSRHLGKSGQLGCTPSSFAGNDFVLTVTNRAHQYRLHDTLRLDRFCEFGQG